MIFGAALLGPECRHGLSGERSSWLLFVVGLELPVPTFSIACVVGSRGVRPLESW
ncbi:transposase for IS2404 [Mycobacterium liflandii 128FXT]|uniref:Transposase for IS2404 n=1 Tax=Mycobacterium liflandii (strain 128FXT) TaxID=459424 RepID=L7VE24_MYCL1|nr:transposase for IS2404 [Mycobacterium liflandii 128FXT]